MIIAMVLEAIWYYNTYSIIIAISSCETNLQAERNLPGPICVELFTGGYMEVSEKKF